MFPPKKFLKYKLGVKKYGSQMRPHVLRGLVWIQIVCKGHDINGLQKSQLAIGKVLNQQEFFVEFLPATATLSVRF